MASPMQCTHLHLMGFRFRYLQHQIKTVLMISNILNKDHKGIMLTIHIQYLLLVPGYIADYFNACIKILFDTSE